MQAASQRAPSRLAIVSGASSGIGKATALQLAAQGWRVLALGRRAAAPAEFAALDAIRYGSGDLAQEDAAQLLQRVAPDALDAVEALVHCAGHDLGGGKPFDQHAPGEWLAGLRLNVEAAMRLTQLCLPAMLAREAGDIVLIGSITARRPAAGLAAYSTGKHALRGFAQALRADYPDSGVRITEIAPGVVRTGFAGSRLHGDTAGADAFYQGFAQLLEPEDVARAVCYALAQPPHVSIAEMVLLPTRERR
ncbi:Serine 3-dehydrogenase [Variovorax sp. SRS16]|uniref:SDR family oxidoreductase n=1 Tax=Variovorax sp. SRS16 TaxID=282217 RepID=UPI001315D85E|nr:SDR family oxidoreductase [Variovorax sp. SRS16]VTU22714.1 Serine 3-dehydrogenase [Variovorax sp. SRS16]